MIFQRAIISFQKLKADLILVLNKTFQKVNLPIYIRFSKVGYSQLDAIFELFIKKSNIEDLLRDYLTILIQVTKLIDSKIIEVKALEYWHKLKVYRMMFMYYLEKKNKVVLLGNCIFYWNNTQNYTIIID